MERHSALRRKRAQALAEMAVMVPFLIIGMMGMLDLGRAFYYQIAITNAVREGARYAVTPFYLGLNASCQVAPPFPDPGANCVTPSDDAIVARINQELQYQGAGIQIPSSQILIQPNQAQRATAFNDGTSPQYPITVSASYQFYFITPIIGSLIGDPLTIHTSAVFRAEY
ncbi:MAG TPA: TadE family protein [Candidatus Dormibacteraeota bacterium]|nr:TadE family protein [Candidatus Dormibacteraeota bacterium]